VLHDFHLLDTDFEKSFDRITSIGASMFKVPMCLVSLVDTDRQWFKACWGLDARETSRDAAFCGYVILPNAPEVMTVCDAQQDPRFFNNPLVTGPPHIRFYAGAPLLCNGQKIGTFCILDRKPRELLTQDEKRNLKLLAEVVCDQIDRRQIHKQLEVEHAQNLEKAHEISLRNEELAALIDSANAPIFAVDSSMKVTVWNQKIADLTSIRSADVCGRSLEDIMSAQARSPSDGGYDQQRQILAQLRPASGGSQSQHVGAAPPDDDSFSDGESGQYRSALRSAFEGKRCTRFDLQMSSRTHLRPVHLQVSAEPKWNAEGQVVGAVCVGEDVLARERMVQSKIKIQQMQKANDAKSAFLACMSHEMRTPLNGLLGMLELADVSDELSNVRRCVKQARNSGTLLLNLINDILDIARIEEGRLPLDLAVFSLHPVLEETIDILRPRAKEKQLELLLDVEQCLHTACLNGDATRIRQVLLNLLWNAVKFTQSGRICLFARQLSQDDDKMRLRFEVQDTGIGIDPSLQEEVFERYVSERVRHKTADSRDQNGTGLGLSICKQLVKLMGGKIWLTSEVGAGTSVFVELPMAVGKPVQRSASDTQLDEAVCSTPTPASRVLVVEDNDFNVDVCKEILEHMGHQVAIAYNGEEAIRVVKGVSDLNDGESPFDVILMDCDMPVMDGFEATAVIRKWEEETARPERLPIVALTAHAMSDVKHKCFACGMDDYMTKPLSMQDLRERLRAHHHRKAKRAAAGSSALPSPHASPLQSSHVSDTSPPAATSLLDRRDSADTAVLGVPMVRAKSSNHSSLDNPLVAALRSHRSSEQPAAGVEAPMALPSAAEASPPAFDPAEAANVFDGNLALMQKAFSRYDDTRVRQLTGLLEAGDYAGLKRHAHSLKGGFSYLRAHRASGAAQRLEEMAARLIASTSGSHTNGAGTSGAEAAAAPGNDALDQMVLEVQAEKRDHDALEQMVLEVQAEGQQVQVEVARLIGASTS